MNQGLIIFGIIVLIIWIGLTIWLIVLIKKFVEKDNPLAGKLLEIDWSLLGQPFHPVRLFMFSKTFYPNKELSETMYIVEIAKYGETSTPTMLFYRIDSETFKLFSESDCKEFRLTSDIIQPGDGNSHFIKPGDGNLYFEAYSGMR